MNSKLIKGLLVTLLLVGGIGGSVVLVQQRQAIISRALNLGQASPTPPAEFKFYESEDLNQNGLIDDQDLVIFREKYEAKDPVADLDNSGQVNSVDYSLFVSKMQ